MKNLGTVEIALLVAVVVIAILLYVNRNCSSCKNRLTAIQGSWPGAGPGVMERAGNATSAAPAE